MPFITEGESVALSGNWTTHPDYGEQFKAEYYETVMPSDEESIIKYLSSGIISGIREATAKNLSTISTGRTSNNALPSRQNLPKSKE